MNFRIRKIGSKYVIEYYDYYEHEWTTPNNEPGFYTKNEALKWFKDNYSECEIDVCED